MGEIGTPTRILAGKFGAPFTYATLHHERKLAPGQISYKMMRDIYRYESINADTEVYAVIADPVTQSMDPVIHNVGFAHMEQNKVLVPFRVPRDELSEFLGDCEELGIRGLSVAIPHKEEILRNLSKADGVVRGIGACNTVTFEGRESVGYNTDYRGFLEALDDVFHESEKGMTLAGRTALVLGAGGASKGILYGLKRRDAEVYISSRTYERALLMAEGFRCRSVQWYERNKIDADILVNATPLGMHPNVDETPMDAKYLKRGMVVVDTVHNPEQTLLIKQAKEQNCRVVSGVELYTRQAALQFQHFTEMEPPLDLMKTAYRRIIGPAKWQD
jgi:3-dehydroquinate dehydratase/shikimate dehydrogenase